MTTDYPDFTRLMQVIGSDIMIPIDVQAAYIMMPIDIQAQYVNLEVDIVAQTVGNIGIDVKAQTVGNIGIDIKAQTVGNIAVNIASAITLNVDITAQTIGNLVIDIEAQSVGIYLKADWEVLQGTDKNLDGNATCNDGNLTQVLSQEVTAGKTFYICQWGFNVDENTGAKAVLWKYGDTTTTILAENGGQVGGAQSLTKPIAIAAGDYVRVSLQQWSGGNILGHGSVGGYEI